MVFINRKIEQQIHEVVKYFPALVLTGARQMGKTTLLQQLFPDYNYVTLDRPLTAEQAETDPESFLAQNPPPLVVDEVQYAPSLFRWLKIRIDENRSAKGQFVLTGSQKLTLMKGVSESLAGRAAILELEGLGCQELLDAGMITASPEVYKDIILRGGFPELWVDKGRPTGIFFDSYIATYLERDVKQILSVGNLRDFERFLRACALRSSQILNKSELARDVGISATTAGEWLSVLQASSQIVLLEPWFSNLTKRLVKSPKLFLTEPALILALSGITAENILKSPMIGAIWESFVFAELRKQLSFSGVKPRLWYYRDQSGREADFIWEQGHQLVLFECKWTSSPTSQMAKNLYDVETIFRQSATSHYEIMDKRLVTRGMETVRGEDVSYRSPLAGLL
ncbi:MAG: ATP-binding protein [Oligoflexales bacterium]|nr:ATP-binding protein [Oligoflexales bacterium]